MRHQERPDATISASPRQIKGKTVMKYLRIRDHLENFEAEPGSLSPSDLSGSWLNTNKDTPGITRVTCRTDGNTLRVRFEGNGSSEPSDWGEVTPDVMCAANIQGGPAMSFVASFDLGFKKVRVGANLNQNLLVIASYHSSQNETGAGASNYFAREFFYHADQS